MQIVIMNSFTVSITRDIIASSYCCGTENEVDMIGNHCAISKALRERFPDVFVSGTYIHPFGDESDVAIPLPDEAIKFIHRFDALADTPEERMGLPEFHFTVVLNEELSYAKMD
jgi:hypothetical protein